MALAVKGIQITQEYAQFENPSGGQLAVKGIQLQNDIPIKLYAAAWFALGGGSSVVNSVTLTHPTLPDVSMGLVGSRYETPDPVAPAYFLEGSMELDVTYTWDGETYNSVKTFPVRKVGYVNFANYEDELQGPTLIDLTTLSLNREEMNRALVELDSVAPAGIAGRTVVLRGFGPDEYTGNRNGLAAQDSLTTKLVTVLISSP